MDKGYVIKLLGALKTVMGENRDYLISLDSVVGDGDLGLTMGYGFAAAYDAVADTQETDIGKILYQAGKAMSTAVPSTMGTLMASGLMSAGKALKGKSDIDIQGIYGLFAAYEDGVSNRGKAKVGDKTFLDGLHPAVVSLEASAKAGDTLDAAAEKAFAAAEKGFKDTKGMLAVHGRAATRGEASRELEDPGAAVAMLMMKALAKSV
jgi:dihydroxyacetone kinase-like protein